MTNPDRGQVERQLTSEERKAAALADARNRQAERQLEKLYGQRDRIGKGDLTNRETRMLLDEKGKLVDKRMNIARGRNEGFIGESHIPKREYWGRRAETLGEARKATRSFENKRVQIDTGSLPGRDLRALTRDTADRV